jgi:hypothetical protein
MEGYLFLLLDKRKNKIFSHSAGNQTPHRQVHSLDTDRLTHTDSQARTVFFKNSPLTYKPHAFAKLPQRAAP